MSGDLLADLEASLAKVRAEKAAAGPDTGACDLCGNERRPRRLAPVRGHGWCWTCLPCRAKARTS